MKKTQSTIFPESMKWFSYLIGIHFKVRAYHDSIKYFLEQQLSLRNKQKWVSNRIGYAF